MEPAVVWHSPEVKVGPSREGLRAGGDSSGQGRQGGWEGCVGKGKDRTPAGRKGGLEEGRWGQQVEG